MSIQLLPGISEFVGPYPSPDYIQNRSGVYVVLTTIDQKNYTVVDVGESDDVKYRITHHDRKPCWMRHNRGTIWYAVYYAPEATRRKIEQQIRQRYSPPCGER